MSDYPPPQQPGWGQPVPPQQPGGFPPPGQGYPPPGPPQQPGWGQPGQQPPQQPGWGQPPQQPNWGQPGQQAQPGWGQPGQGGFAPQAPVKKKKVWPWVLGGVLLLLVLMFGGCALLINKGIGAVTAPVDAANAWLAAAEVDDVDELETLTCDADSTVIDLGVSGLAAAGFDGSKSLNSSNIVNGAATVSGTIGTDSGDAPVQVSLSKAADGEGASGWCVNGVFVG